MAVKFMIDSASDISKSQAEKMDVALIPMIINFEDQSYFDGVDLSPEEFYEKLIESDDLPKTSQITQYRFEEELDILTENGDEVIVIVLSSKLSATYESALRASKKYNGKVFVLDSLSAAIGEYYSLGYLGNEYFGYAAAYDAKMRAIFERYYKCPSDSVYFKSRGTQGQTNFSYCWVNGVGSKYYPTMGVAKTLSRCRVGADDPGAMIMIDVAPAFCDTICKNISGLTANYPTAHNKSVNVLYLGGHVKTHTVGSETRTHGSSSQPYDGVKFFDETKL